MTKASLCPHSLPFETGKSTSWFPKACAVLLALFVDAEGNAVPSFRDHKAALEYKPSSFVHRRQAFAKRFVGSSNSSLLEWLVQLEKPVLWAECLHQVIFGRGLPLHIGVMYSHVVFNSL